MRILGLTFNLSPDTFSNFQIHYKRSLNFRQVFRNLHLVHYNKLQLAPTCSRAKRDFKLNSDQTLLTD